MFSFYLLGVGRVGSHPSSLLNHFSTRQTQLLKSSAPAHREARALASTSGPTVCPTAHNRKCVRAGWAQGGWSRPTGLGSTKRKILWRVLGVRVWSSSRSDVTLASKPQHPLCLPCWPSDVAHGRTACFFKVQATGNHIWRAWHGGYFYTVHFFPFLFICFLHFFQFAFAPWFIVVLFYF